MRLTAVNCADFKDEEDADVIVRVILYSSSRVSNDAVTDVLGNEDRQRQQQRHAGRSKNDREAQHAQTVR
jgi:hypothetical protein